MRPEEAVNYAARLLVCRLRGTGCRTFRSGIGDNHESEHADQRGCKHGWPHQTGVGVCGFHRDLRRCAEVESESSAHWGERGKRELLSLGSCCGGAQQTARRSRGRDRRSTNNAGTDLYEQFGLLLIVEFAAFQFTVL